MRHGADTQGVGYARVLRRMRVVAAEEFERADRGTQDLVERSAEVA